MAKLFGATSMQDLKGSIFTTVLGAVLGLVGTVIAYRINKDEPTPPPPPAIEIVRSAIEISPNEVGVAEKEVAKWLLATGWKAPESYDERWPTGNAISRFLINRIDIRNTGEKIYNEVIVRLPGFTHTVVNSQGETRGTTEQEITLKLAPNEFVSITGVSDGGVTDDGRVIDGTKGDVLVAIGDTPIPIKTFKFPVEEAPQTALGLYFKNSGFWGFMLAYYVAASTFIMTMLILGSIFSSINITFSKPTKMPELPKPPEIGPPPSSTARTANSSGSVKRSSKTGKFE